MDLDYVNFHVNVHACVHVHVHDFVRVHALMPLSVFKAMFMFVSPFKSEFGYAYFNGPLSEQGHRCGHWH
jgi:hypothetical protein